MERTDLFLFRKWFTSYIAGYRGPDGNGAGAIHLKEDHTARTCEEITLIGRALKLPEGDLLLAETIALFHDLGRFPQWQRYGTFIDRDSEDHALLGLTELARFKLLDRIPADEAEVVKEAIRHHNVKELPTQLPPRALSFAKLLRDADKLDIWRLVIRARAGRSGRSTPRAYSPEIMVELQERRIPDFDLVHSPTDMQLLRLAWVYDLNFAATCREVLERGYLDALFEHLPDAEDLSELQYRLSAYLQQRVDQENSGEHGPP